ncbi:MAG: isopentenyl phosphate kinase family protein [Candidatus Levybacteria bacterium]|nr:isopentenyl phosphate kinase family protein [Candidatus Levybacteria bacterium]
MRNLMVVKLGGSVITDKLAKRGLFRKNVVERLAREIKIAKDRGKFSLILVHGAGSFAHPIAKKYRLNEGYIDTLSSEGFARTKIGVVKLNLLVWQELEKANLAACIVESSAVIRASSGRIKELDTKFIEMLLAQNIIPLLSGDVVIDEKMGFSIISGDQIVAFLAKRFDAKKVVFVSDVDGVFDRDPARYKDAKIIPEINIRNYQNIIGEMKVKNESDVTGEMRGKILSIKRSLSGIKVLIVNGFVRENVLKSLVNNKRQNFGTVINF